MERLVAKRDNFGSKAPIVEALIDIATAAPVDVSNLRGLADDLLVAFPLSFPQVKWDLSLNLGPTGESTGSAAPAPRGFLLRTADGTRAVQLRLDGFTMSHLYPYKSWEALRDDAFNLWSRYAAAARVDAVSRVAVRYLNRMELPVEDPLSRWLTLRPETPGSLGLQPSEFALASVFQHPQHAATAIVNVRQEPLLAGRPRAIVLDVDCYFDRLALHGADPSIWTKLEALREFKNDIFFGSITQDTVERFR